MFMSIGNHGNVAQVVRDFRTLDYRPYLTRIWYTYPRINTGQRCAAGFPAPMIELEHLTKSIFAPTWSDLLNVEMARITT